MKPMKRTMLALSLLLAGIAAPALADDTTSMQSLIAAARKVGKADVVASYGTDPVDRGGLRLPAGKGPFPVVVLVHGGCWSTAFGGAQDMLALADALTKRGFATWNIEYRRVGNPGGGWPGTFQDVGAGIDHLRDLAKTQPLDLTRVVVVGHSSGAHLALLAAARGKLHDPVAGANPLIPAAVVAIDGPGTLAPFVGIDTQVCGGPAIVPFMGGTPAEKPAAYTLASPADHMPFGVRQLLVLGELGPLMQPYVTAAKTSGDAVETLAPAGGDHFNIIDPTTPQGAAVVDFIATRALAKSH